MPNEIKRIIVFADKKSIYNHNSKMDEIKRRKKEFTESLNVTGKASSNLSSDIDKNFPEIMCSNLMSSREFSSNKEQGKAMFQKI